MPIFVQVRDPPSALHQKCLFSPYSLVMSFIKQKAIPLDCSRREQLFARKEIFLMTRSLSQEPDEIKYAGLAIECGHLNAFLEGVRLQCDRFADDY